jgi:hypothetical protein
VPCLCLSHFQVRLSSRWFYAIYLFDASARNGIGIVFDFIVLGRQVSGWQ